MGVRDANILSNFRSSGIFGFESMINLRVSDARGMLKLLEVREKCFMECLWVLSTHAADEYEGLVSLLFKQIRTKGNFNPSSENVRGRNPS